MSTKQFEKLQLQHASWQKFLAMGSAAIGLLVMCVSVAKNCRENFGTLVLHRTAIRQHLQFGYLMQIIQMHSTRAHDFYTIHQLSTWRILIWVQTACDVMVGRLLTSFHTCNKAYVRKYWQFAEITFPMCSVDPFPFISSIHHLCQPAADVPDHPTVAFKMADAPGKAPPPWWRDVVDRGATGGGIFHT